MNTFLIRDILDTKLICFGSDGNFMMPSKPCTKLQLHFCRTDWFLGLMSGDVLSTVIVGLSVNHLAVDLKRPT